MEEMISDMVYSVTSYSVPPKSRCTMSGRPSADCRVWCVMEYDTRPMPSSLEICSMMSVLPMPGAPMSSTGRWRESGILKRPCSSRAKYACTARFTCVFASWMFMDKSSFVVRGLRGIGCVAPLGEHRRRV